MYKVVLVDDEPIITKGLQAFLDWEDYGFEIVYVAENGEEALAFIKENTIHLLITDIIMPKMSGLELIEAAKVEQEHLKYIILSGYQDFDYIKQGMTLGIENYLLKPVDEEELIKTVRTVSDKLNASLTDIHDLEFMTLKDNTLWRLLNGEIEKNEWRERLLLYDMNVEYPYYCVSILDFENDKNKEISKSVRSAIEKQYSATCLFNPDQELIILFGSNDDEELYGYNDILAESLKDETFGTGDFYLSMGTPVSSMGEVEDSYLLARKYSLYQVCLETNIVISDQTDIDRQALIKKQQEYKTDMVKRVLNSKKDVMVGINNFYHSLCKNGTFIGAAVARKYTIDLISYIHYSIQDVKHYNHTAAIEKVFFTSDIKQMAVILYDYCEELILTINNHQEIRSPIVQNVLEYIHVNYKEGLSLKTLSQRFHVNPIYLGQLFQKEIGIVFSEYINQYRLDKAKELLKTTFLRAGEIGEKVGYTDPTYFYKQFKKNVGATPTEWRNIK